MGVFQNNLLAGSAAAASAGGAGFYSYQIEQSLRLDGTSNQYMYKAVSGATAQTQFTVSFWIKRAGAVDTGSRQVILGNSDGAGQIQIRADDSNDTMRYSSYGGIETDGVYRGTSGWYHFHIYRATTNNNAAIYVNGVNQSLSANTAGSSGIFRNSSNLEVGSSNGGSNNFHGYVAEMYGIYDQNLAHTVFGEFKNGVWIPKDASASITFGSQDFYLKFENASDLGNDSSGNNNDFTVSNLGADHQVLDSPTFGS
jgi:hypothetical protein